MMNAQKKACYCLQIEASSAGSCSAAVNMLRSEEHFYFPKRLYVA